jgi:hypothetical protein
MEYVPLAKLEVLKLATPPLRVPVPSVVDPLINVTVPVAADGLTVAVNVIGALAGAGLVEDDTVVEEACSTLWVSLEEVLVL